VGWPIERSCSVIKKIRPKTCGSHCVCSPWHTDIIKCTTTTVHLQMSVNGQLWRSSSSGGVKFQAINFAKRKQFSYCCMTLTGLAFGRHLAVNILSIISRKSVLWEPSCCIWTDRQTDMTWLLTVAFRSCFAKASKRNTRYCRWLSMTMQCERLNRRMMCLIRYRRLQLKVAAQSRYSPYWFITKSIYLNVIALDMGDFKHFAFDYSNFS